MTEMALDRLSDGFWREYSLITPDAPRIHQLLGARGEKVVNDHVAFRTFDLAPIDVESLARVFTELGYEPSGDYEFVEKKLHARSFKHATPGRPHIFISELLTGQCSPELRRFAEGLAAQARCERADPASLLTRTPTWAPVSYDDYRRLLDESEYAGWLAAFGLRVNHFTVSVNSLSTFNSIQELNDWLVAQGFRLNESGGRVKGTPAQLLEQSSTLASRIEWEFKGGVRQVIPGCYYEFARRYADPSTGRLYEGFIARSADKIFESTDTKLS